jgi:hypothetical protein
VNLSQNTRITDTDLARFTGLKRLHTLDFSDSSVTTAGINSLGDLPVLWEIDLERTKVDPEGIRGLTRFVSLRTVKTSTVPLTDEDAAFLAERTPNITGLFAPWSKITDAGLRSLLQKPQFHAGVFNGISDLGVEPLRSRQNMLLLHLYQCRVTRKGVEAIASCPNLSELKLTDNPNIDDACVTEIAKLSKLKRPVLSGTAITDSCVDDLTKLTNLKELVLPQATITPAALTRLRAALPACDIQLQ